MSYNKIDQPNDIQRKRVLNGVLLCQATVSAISENIELYLNLGQRQWNMYR